MGRTRHATDFPKLLPASALAVAVVLVAISGVAWFKSRAAHAQSQGFTFALIGDMAYYEEHEPWLVNVHAEISKEQSLAFVAHVGDLSRPVRSCGEETLKLRLSQFNTMPHPVIFTPGDNDWTDCHDKQGVKGGDPLAALDRLRAMFFAGDESLGERKMPVTRQSQSPEYAKFRENVRWDIGGITFVTLHITGSNNNLGRTPEGDAEYKERNAANLVWLQQAFAHAKANTSRAVMIIQQANIFERLPAARGTNRKTERLHGHSRPGRKGDHRVSETRGPGPRRQPFLPDRQSVLAATAARADGHSGAGEFSAGGDLRIAGPPLGPCDGRAERSRRLHVPTADRGRQCDQALATALPRASAAAARPPARRPRA